jgi:hypothetical protein
LTLSGALKPGKIKSAPPPLWDISLGPGTQAASRV